MRPLNISKWVFFLFSFLALSCGQKDNSKKTSDAVLPEFVETFIKSGQLANASLSVIVSDSKDGKTLFAYQPDKSLVPASVQKLLISSAALEQFGPDYRFKTTIFYDGPIDNKGVLDGNIIIKGGGDPAFGAARFKDHYGDIIRKISDAVIKAGINKINGDIIADVSYFGKVTYPDTWIWEDIGNYFGALPSGLNIFENTYTLTFSSGPAGSLTKIIDVNPEIPGITFENFVTASAENRDNAWIFGSYLTGNREVRGTIPDNRSSFTIKGAIPDPAAMTATLLRESLEGQGIRITGKATSTFAGLTSKEMKSILEIESPPLSEIVMALNMNSINLYADALLLQLARGKGKAPSFDEACSVLSDFWKERGMDINGMFLEDGSGLSRANGLTAKQLSWLLQYMKNQSKYPGDFIASLPVAGNSGSLKNLGKGTVINGKFSAKSGYMSRVMNYAGYLTTAKNREFTVVVMVNNYTCSNQEMRSMLEQLLADICEMNDNP